MFGSFRNYVLLASNSGSSPPIFVPPLVIIPLVPDALFFATVQAAFTFTMPELIGVTPQNGVTRTRITFPPGIYGIPLGSDITFAYALWNPLTLGSNPVTVTLVR